MWETLGAVRDLGRLQEIASVLIRNGFGDMVRRVGLAGALERAGRLLHWQHAEETLRMEPPERLRRALEALGPTFVKLGQVLATRIDLLPPEWIAELSRLQNAVPALPYDAIRPQLIEDLGDAPENIFARLDPEPLAAASLAQAHRAWLDDGTAVVLKVRRPGIREVVEADLRLLARLAEIIQAQVPDLRRYHPVGIAQQFAASLRAELDFASECRNAERIAFNFRDHPEVLIPAVHWQWTSERLSVQDWVDGIPGCDLAAVDAAGLDRHALASTGAAIVLKMVLVDGLFHADPHPGNVFYLRDGRIGLIDFGMVGGVSEQRRFQVARLLNGLVGEDPEAVTDILLDWTEGDASVDETRLQADVGVFTDRYRGVPLKQLRMGAMLTDVAALLRRHGLSLPPDLALMIKAFLTLEGLGRQLDPEFDMASEARPYLERAILDRYSPRAVARRGRRSLSGALDLVGDMPRDLRRLLQAARRGRLRGQLDITSLKAFGDQLNSAANRLTIGVVTAALIIGSSIVMNSVGGGISNRWLMAMGVLGFVFAAMTGVWIVLSIWRSGRK
ncbi:MULTISPECIES: AarF/UbiB family protein [Pseudoxanthomonas]|uniref:ABC1 kinase family protein n=1 Tax=Pseudoxanthomonas TaxID=83618 RepID=UPI0016155E8A|nr:MULTISPECIES: AarF/UbiB family protein [Pseudoxanthomonas]MBB3277291.1 ubiquinone biosynthesis protein [Pseudoxanthomonas sp. OG2]MBD9376400.1 ubiquinone biosynthesis protein UbiB [Pseudoxanthomonas sp. PXM04]MBV7474055.1 ubiquinone biosynthesis protein UbiB [Pseudoxanthomonas sp. PXM05]